MTDERAARWSKGRTAGRLRHVLVSGVLGVLATSAVLWAWDAYRGEPTGGLWSALGGIVIGVLLGAVEWHINEQHWEAHPSAARAERMALADLGGGNPYGTLDTPARSAEARASPVRAC